MRREAFAINLPEFAQILRCLNMAFLGFGLHQVEFEVKQIEGERKGALIFQRTVDGRWSV